MSSDNQKENAREAIISLFDNLDILEMQELIGELATLAEAKKAEEKERLLARLRAIGVETPGLPHLEKESESPRGAPAKYRSKRDPNLTWSGRGHVAGWLRDEMEETKLPREAFRIME